MRIENIIEDIKNDIIELSEKLQEQLRKDHPAVNFSVSLPGIEELATIKSIALTIKEGDTLYHFSVYIHTHNGSRVFENPPQQIINNQFVPFSSRHPFQDRFVNLLRDIIKKNKHRTRPAHKSGDFLSDIQQYASPAW